jgi:cytidylate kinase
MRPKIVAVDGPAGSGKSSICQLVCRDIGWSYVNTGALYRAIGFLAAERGLVLEESGAFYNLLDEFERDFFWDHSGGQLFFGSRDLTGIIASVEAGNAASAVAKIPHVRERLLPLQRQLALSAQSGVMLDGRDIGTVVFPDADMKIFMTANLEMRATRRLKQLEKSGTTGVELQSIIESIAQRDAQDSGRGVAPMKCADNAVVFDTSQFSIVEAVEALKELLRSRNLI